MTNPPISPIHALFLATHTHLVMIAQTPPPSVPRSLHSSSYCMGRNIVTPLRSAYHLFNPIVIPVAFLHPLVSRTSSLDVDIPSRFPCACLQAHTTPLVGIFTYIYDRCRPLRLRESFSPRHPPRRSRSSAGFCSEDSDVKDLDSWMTRSAFLPTD